MSNAGTHGAALTVKVWGARGSTPVSGDQYCGAGGNTACIQILLRSGQSLIVDAGTGIRALGDVLAARPLTEPNTLLLTHFHWDHIQGLPFFAPLYRDGADLHILSGFKTGSLERALHDQMQQPYFPVSLGATNSRKRYAQLTGEPKDWWGAQICSFALHHPGGCFGYRIQCDGASVVVATDHEFGNVDSDNRLAHFANSADLMILDAQFTPEEAALRRGWGHSSWQEAARFAAAAGVKHLALFHHDPSRTDEQLQEILRHAQAEFCPTSLASESHAGSASVLTLGKTSFMTSAPYEP